MLVILSPSKTLDFSKNGYSNYTLPNLMGHSVELIDILKALSQDDLMQLMGLSDKLAELNYNRFRDFSAPFSLDNAKQAILAFKGNVYDGIDVSSYNDQDFSWAQDHLRIISGLYGLLRPLDLIQPYRLEMGTKLATHKGKSLYDFWGDMIASESNAQLDVLDSSVVVNLASNEYSKAILPSSLLLDKRVITPSFKEYRNGSYKMMMVYVKKARGLMASYFVKNKIAKPDQLKDFDVEGYRYNPDLSSDNDWVFTRQS